MLRRACAIGVVLTVGFLVLASVGQGSTTPRRCQGSQFKLTRGPSDAALGNYRQTVRLHNVSHAACAMSGWFKVQLLNTQGAVLTSTERHITRDMFGTSPKPKVVVAPGGGASFAIDTTAPATSCPYSKTIAVTPPSGHGSKRLSLVVLACAHFSALPVQPDNRAIHP